MILKLISDDGGPRSRPRAGFNNPTAIYIKLAVHTRARAVARGIAATGGGYGKTRPLHCGRSKYRDLKTGSFLRETGGKDPGLARNNARERAHDDGRSCGIIIINGLRVACLLQKNC